MSNKHSYKTKGVCSRVIHLEEENGIIRSVCFEGGCDGNLQGICRLVTGRRPEEIIPLLEGISCEGKPTSCPDQLTKALNEIIAKR